MTKPDIAAEYLRSLKAAFAHIRDPATPEAEARAIFHHVCISAFRSGVDTTYETMLRDIELITATPAAARPQ